MKRQLRTALVSWLVCTVALASHDTIEELQPNPLSGPRVIERPPVRLPLTVPVSTSVQPDADEEDAPPPRLDCANFLGGEVDAALQAFYFVFVHWDVFDDANAVLANRSHTDLSPPSAAGARLDRRIARVDLEATRREGGPWSTASNYFLDKFWRLDSNQDGVISYSEFQEFNLRASVHRYRCRTGEPNRDVIRKACEEKLANYRRMVGVSEATNAYYRSQAVALQAGMRRMAVRLMTMADRAKADLLASNCGFRAEDIQVGFHETIPPMGCPANERSYDGRTTSVPTACEGDDCMECQVTIAGERVGQVCKDVDSAKMALLSFCEYARVPTATCLAELNTPFSCRRSDFKPQVSGCASFFRTSKSKNSDTQVSIGFTPFAPARFGQGAMLNVYTHTRNASLSTSTSLGFLPGKSGTCRLQNGCEFCDDEATPTCTVSIDSVTVTNGSSGFDILGSGYTQTEGESESLNREFKTEIQGVTGSNREKLMMACRLWQGRQQPVIDGEVETYFRGHPAREPGSHGSGSLLDLMGELNGKQAPTPPLSRGNDTAGGTPPRVTGPEPAAVPVPLVGVGKAVPESPLSRGNDTMKGRP